MKQLKLFDSELKVMELLWENDGITAKELSLLANDRIGWNKNTTYTVIKKLVAKKVIKRSEPNFMCHALVNRDDVSFAETKGLIDTFFDGSVKTLFSSFLSKEKLSDSEISELKKMIDDYDTK